MLADKLRCTDWEATNEAMEEAVARESYLEWLRDGEKRARGTRTLVLFSAAFLLELCILCMLFWFNLPKFAITQSESLSTVLISAK